MNRRRLLQLVLVCLVLSALVSPVRRELYVGDETKYGEVIREMRTAHVFFVPILGGEPFSHKPPVHFWMVDGLTYLFGLYSLWSFVIPSLAAYVLLLVVMLRMTREMAGEGAAWWSALAAGSSLLIWGSAQTARMDVSFTLALTAGIWLLYRFLRDDDFGALFVAAVLIAFATLIKGPMAPIIAVILLVLERIRTGRRPRGNYLPAIAATVVIPLLWVIPAVAMRGRGFAQEILVKQTVGRAISTWVHKAPPWFYLIRSPLTLFPWFFAFIAAAYFVIRTRRAEHRQNAEPLWFCLDWVVAVVLPYSIMSSKLDVYMMAAIPPAALLVGWFVGKAVLASTAGVPDTGLADWETGAFRKAAAFAIGGNALTLLLLTSCGFALLLARDRVLKGADAALFPPACVEVVGMTFVVIGGAGLIATFSSRAGRLQRSILAVTASVIVPLIAAVAMLIDPINAIASTTPLIAALERQSVAPHSIALYSCPNLWSRDFPPGLEQVRYVGSNIRDGAGQWPLVVATARSHAGEIAPALAHYRQIDQVRMIGKWFDVYRLR